MPPCDLSDIVADRGSSLLRKLCAASESCCVRFREKRLTTVSRIGMLTSKVLNRMKCTTL